MQKCKNSDVRLRFYAYGLKKVCLRETLGGGRAVATIGAGGGHAPPPSQILVFYCIDLQPFNALTPPTFKLVVPPFGGGEEVEYNFTCPPFFASICMKCKILHQLIYISAFGGRGGGWFSP